MRAAKKVCEMNSGGMTDDNLEMLGGQLRMSEYEMEMVKGQLRMAADDLVIYKSQMSPGREWLVTAMRVFMICSLIALSIEILGAVMSARDSSIVAGVGAQISMISTNGCASRRGNASSKLEPSDFVIPVAQVLQETPNTDARALNAFMIFDLAQNTILRSRHSSEARASARSWFAHEDSADNGTAARIRNHIHLDDRAMNGTRTGSPDKLLPDCGVKVLRVNSNNLIMTDPAPRLVIPNATTIYSDNSNDQIIFDRRRLERERTTTLLLKQNTSESHVMRISI
jgi:hypothetical protein